MGEGLHTGHQIGAGKAGGNSTHLERKKKYFWTFLSTTTTHTLTHFKQYKLYLRCRQTGAHKWQLEGTICVNVRFKHHCITANRQ